MLRDSSQNRRSEIRRSRQAFATTRRALPRIAAWGLELVVLFLAFICPQASGAGPISMISLKNNADQEHSTVCRSACAESDPSLIKSAGSSGIWHCYCAQTKTCLWIERDASTRNGTVYIDKPNSEADCLGRRNDAADK